MVFGQQTVLELKASAAKVLEATIEDRAQDVQRAFGELKFFWDSPSIVLFRRSYGNAAISMPGVEQLTNWRNTIDGINRGAVSIRFLKYQWGSDRFLEDISGFYIGLSILESAHIDDINDHYAHK